MRKLKLVKAKTFELDPNKFYLLVFDSRAMHRDDLQNLMRALPANQSIALMVNGDPNDVLKIIEQPMTKATRYCNFCGHQEGSDKKHFHILVFNRRKDRRASKDWKYE